MGARCTYEFTIIWIDRIFNNEFDDNFESHSWRASYKARAQAQARRHERCKARLKRATSGRRRRASSGAEVRGAGICAAAIPHHFTPIMPPPRLSAIISRARPQCQPQYLRKAVCVARYASFESTRPSQTDQPTVPWKTPHSVEAWPPAYLIPPPKDGEVLLERKPNRALPPYGYTLYTC